MHLIVDTHAHLYPCYDMVRAFQAATENLTSAAHSAAITNGAVAAHVLCLTERFDCNYFGLLRDGKLPFSGQIETTAEKEVLRVSLSENSHSLYLVAGHQIITAEKIEVLALACLKKVPDGQSLQATIAAVQNLGGVTVLSWAPGKWFFKRGELVRAVIESQSSGALACGDTTLRPPLWCTPRIMGFAKSRGFQVIAGSDPLPFPGEENQCGRYATVVPTAEFDPDALASTLRRALLQPSTVAILQRCGRRSSTAQVLRRLYKNQRVRKRRV